jgi:hypothetical protein
VFEKEWVHTAMVLSGCGPYALFTSLSFSSPVPVFYNCQLVFSCIAQSSAFGKPGGEVLLDSNRASLINPVLCLEQPLQAILCHIHYKAE